MKINDLLFASSEFLYYINECCLLSVVCNQIQMFKLCLSRLCFLMERDGEFIPLRYDTVSRSGLNFNSSVWEGL